MTKVTINAKTAEKTYKAGDFFLVNGELNQLVRVENNLCALIHVGTGNRWKEPISVLDTAVVTREELNKMTYHDANIQYLESVSITY